MRGDTALQRLQTNLTSDRLHFCLMGLLFPGRALTIRQYLAGDARQRLIELHQFLQGSQLTPRDYLSLNTLTGVR